MELHTFFRSSASYRVRIALNLKGANYTARYVNLRSNEHRSEEFLARNPQGFVPLLSDDGVSIAQSNAIIEWLEERFPDPPLLPAEADERALVRSLAAIIGCDVHPLNNLRVLNFLRGEMKIAESAVTGWCVHWIEEGLHAYQELLLRNPSGVFSFGDSPTIADVFLIPQLFSARRFGVDLSPFSRLVEIEAIANAIPAFRAAAPEAQLDAS